MTIALTPGSVNITAPEVTITTTDASRRHPGGGVHGRMSTIEIAFPYGLDDRGRTATATYDDHVEQMLELLLFTRPGERVNLPTFGCGLLDQVFAPNSPEIAAALNVTIAAAISLWLRDVLSVTSLDVTAQDEPADRQHRLHRARHRLAGQPDPVAFRGGHEQRDAVG